MVVKKSQEKYLVSACKHNLPQILKILSYRQTPLKVFSVMLAILADPRLIFSNSARWRYDQEISKSAKIKRINRKIEIVKN